MKQLLDNKIIGLNVAYYRKIKKYTQKELAKKVEISSCYMAKIESGAVSKCVSLSVLSKIADVLDVSIDKLIKKL